MNKFFELINLIQAEVKFIKVIITIENIVEIAILVAYCKSPLKIRDSM